MEELKDPVIVNLKLIKFIDKEKIDPREMALACKIYESIYEEQSKYFGANIEVTLCDKKFKATVGWFSQSSSHV